MINEVAFETWLCRATFKYVQAFSASLDKRELTYNSDANPSIQRLGSLIDLKRPAAQVRALHDQLFGQLEAVSTVDQRIAFRQLVLSELLTTYPLRRSNWSDMKLAGGRIPDNPPTPLLHIDPKVDPERLPGMSQYKIVVPVSALKNGRKNPELAKLDPPRVVFHLPKRQGRFLDHYLDHVRPQLWDDLGHYRPGRGRPAEESFLGFTSSTSIYRAMIQFQERYLINPLGLERAWGVHPYRALVATHVTKTAKNHPNRTAAALLLNLEKTVRDTYGKFRPEDAYNDVYNGLAALEDTGEDD